MIKFEFEYHIAYMHKIGFGCATLKLNKLIKKGKDVNDIARFFEETNDLQNVGIINWKLLRFKMRFGK
jgi:hypothetical protein